MKKRRSQVAPLVAGAIVIAAGFAVAMAEVLGLPKGSIWVIVALAALLIFIIRLLTRR